MTSGKPNALRGKGGRHKRPITAPTAVARCRHHDARMSYGTTDPAPLSPLVVGICPRTRDWCVPRLDSCNSPLPVNRAAVDYPRFVRGVIFSDRTTHHPVRLCFATGVTPSGAGITWPLSGPAGQNDAEPISATRRVLRPTARPRQRTPRRKTHRRSSKAP